MAEEDWRVVTPEEVQGLLPVIRPFFETLAGRYNEDKYPHVGYRDLRKIFANPCGVQPADIARALRWKYGRDKLLSTHQETAKRCAKRWKLIREVRTLEKKIEVLRDPDVRSHDFVSRVFLVHLTAPSRLPIIDRFNHRAVRWLLGMVRPGFELGGPPAAYDDVLLVRNFIDGVQTAWGDAAPSGRMVDHYLMMLGRQVAPPY